MSGNSSHQALIDQLLRDRDAEYRRASKAEQRLKELTDAKEMKAAYEAKLAEKEEALRERDKTIEAKDNRIPNWNKSCSIWNVKCGERCLRNGRYLMSPINSSLTSDSLKCHLKRRKPLEKPLKKLPITKK